MATIDIGAMLNNLPGIGIAILAVLIACLGLFGLASFTAEQRTKEIGIRKVLGASVLSVFRHVTREFVQLVILANVIVWPLAYFILSRWLQSFAYRVGLAWWTFALTAIGVLALSLLTVSWQILRAATANRAAIVLSADAILLAGAVFLLDSEAQLKGVPRPLDVPEAMSMDAAGGAGDAGHQH